MSFTFRFMSQTQLGQLFNVSSQKIGKWLKEIGLREADGRPTVDAIREGFCKPVATEYTTTMWSWHSEKTVAALRQAGHELLELLPGNLTQSPRPWDTTFSIDNQIDQVITPFESKDEQTIHMTSC